MAATLIDRRQRADTDQAFATLAAMARNKREERFVGIGTGVILGGLMLSEIWPAAGAAVVFAVAGALAFAALTFLLGLMDALSGPGRR